MRSEAISLFPSAIVEISPGGEITLRARRRGSNAKGIQRTKACPSCHFLAAGAMRIATRAQ